MERCAVGMGAPKMSLRGVQVMDSDEGDRDERDLGAKGEERCTVEERLELSVHGATAFGEDENAEASAEGADAGGEAGEGGSGVGGVDGDLAGTVEVPADEGEAPQLLFGEDAELEREAGEDDRGIHVTGVVGGEDGSLRGNVFDADDLEAGAGPEDAGAGPATGNAVLKAAGFIPKRGNEGKGAEDAGGEEEWWGQ